MTQQQQVSKVSTRINLNTILMGLMTSAIIWFGTLQVKIYKAVLLQPGVDAIQTDAILKMGAKVTEIDREQALHTGRLIYLEAIMPYRKQLKVK